MVHDLSEGGGYTTSEQLKKGRDRPENSSRLKKKDIPNITRICLQITVATYIAEQKYVQ